jgi:hypothetical protein
MHDSLQGATFHLEHVIPRSRGGRTELSNLAWACPSCNLHKSDRVQIPCDLIGELVPLFNPRTDNWEEHFRWTEFQLEGKTVVGRAAVIALCLNEPRKIRIRQAELLFGLFPPDVE